MSIKSYLKASTNSLLAKYGLKLVNITDKPDTWFNYTTYPQPSTSTSIKKYLESVKSYKTVGLFGFTDLARHLIDGIVRTHPHVKIVGIVDKLASHESSNSNYLGIPIVPPQQTAIIKPEAWVLCDLDNGYLDYEFVRGLGSKEIIHNSLFHKSPWDLSDFHVRLRSMLTDMPETMLDDARQLTLIECVRYCSGLEGNILEIGSYKGGSGFLICQTLNAIDARKKVMLVDWYQHQSAQVSLATVQKIFVRFDFTEVISGKAEDILPDILTTPLCFTHIDINGDETIVENVLPLVYKKLVPGGMILFDNYYFRYFSKYNFDKFAKRFNEHIMLLPSIPQGLLIKSQQI